MAIKCVTVLKRSFLTYGFSYTAQANLQVSILKNWDHFNANCWLSVGGSYMGSVVKVLK